MRKNSGGLFFIQVQIFQLSEIRLSKESARAGIHSYVRTFFEIQNCEATFNYVETATFCTYSTCLSSANYESESPAILFYSPGYTYTGLWLGIVGVHTTRFKGSTFARDSIVKIRNYRN